MEDDSREWRARTRIKKNNSPQIAQMAADRGRLMDAGAAVYREREKNGQQGREQDSPADGAGPGTQHWNKASLDLVLMDC
jgi:hypothetical protein